MAVPIKINFFMTCLWISGKAASSFFTGGFEGDNAPMFEMRGRTVSISFAVFARMIRRRQARSRWPHSGPFGRDHRCRLSGVFPVGNSLRSLRRPPSRGDALDSNEETASKAKQKTLANSPTKMLRILNPLKLGG